MSLERRWDRHRECWVTRLLPGQWYVSGEYEVIQTLLGSCISACIRDPIAGVGGMNHFLVPMSERAPESLWARPEPTIYGVHAMELLVNDLLFRGGSRRRLEAKVFGGGRILQDLASVGAQNVRFIREYLEAERIPLRAEDLGGAYLRRVLYFPHSGRAMVKKASPPAVPHVELRERTYLDDLRSRPPQGAIELF